MSRLRIAPSYLKAAAALSSKDFERAAAALAKFLEDPDRPGLNFEPVRGMADHYSIRVSRSHRILLRKEHDAEGDLFAAVDVGTHQVYRRR
jgi:hypothetical protein